MLGQELSVIEIQRLLGLMAAAANIFPLGLLHMRHFQFWLKSIDFHPLYHPCRVLRVMCRGLCALPLWKKPGCLNRGLTLGACCYCGLGCGSRWPTSPWSMGGPSSLLAHKLPWDEGSVPSSETLPSKAEGLPCFGSYRQHFGSLLHQSLGRASFAPPFQVGAADLALAGIKDPFSESSLYSEAYK